MNLELSFDSEIISILHLFIRKRVQIARAKKVVIGLSGGLDSTVVARLCVDALGPEKVLCLLMPVQETPDTAEGRRLAGEFEVDYHLVDLQQGFTTLLETYQDSLGLRKKDMSMLVQGNFASRLRMASLYFTANSISGMVMGTSNKTELLTGYFSKYGDGASDAIPLGDLYKTQVRLLAQEIGIPERVIEKPPTAGFFQGQTDEGDLGMDYSSLDRVLYGLELKLSNEEIAASLGMELAEVQRIEKMVQRAAHKRALGMVPKFGVRTPGFDWRENMDFGLE